MLPARLSGPFFCARLASSSGAGPPLLPPQAHCLANETCVAITYGGLSGSAPSYGTTTNGTPISADDMARGPDACYLCSTLRLRHGGSTVGEKFNVYFPPQGNVLGSSRVTEG